MLGLLVSSSVQKWEGGKHSTRVLIWSANLGMKLLHLTLKFCVSCNICVFVSYLKHPFITVLQQRPAWQLCLNTVQNKGDHKALFHVLKTNEMYRCHWMQNNIETPLLGQSGVWPRQIAWHWQASPQLLDKKPRIWVIVRPCCQEYAPSCFLLQPPLPIHELGEFCVPWWFSSVFLCNYFHFRWSLAICPGQWTPQLNCVLWKYITFFLLIHFAQHFHTTLPVLVLEEKADNCSLCICSVPVWTS